MKLRYILFAALSGIAVLPVVALSAWTFANAVDREMADVRDKHLVIATNVGAALDRYALDLRNAFDMVAGLRLPDAGEGPVATFLTSLDFLHFCVAELPGGRIERCIATVDGVCPSQVPPDMLALFLDLAAGGGTVFSPVMKNPSGTPVIYLLRRDGLRLFIGAVATDYIVRQGQAVAFGEKGHAAIVDRRGNLIAHPRADWQADVRNIAKVKPVQRMMAQETGVTTFHSPALDAEMVSGYTYVPTTGWGVMIPQPLAELRAEAILGQYRALGVALLGIAVAALVSWFLSGYLAGPLTAMAQTARRMAGGDLSARAALDRRAPRELDDLAHSFNGMADEVAKANRGLVTAVTEANRANQAKSEFLACMSHDLRTPLNAIVGIAEAMRSNALGPLDQNRYDNYLSDIQRSGHLLLGLINDILDLSKIEAGSYDLLDTEIDLGQALREAVDLADYMARQRSLTVAVDLPATPPILVCDARSLTQVFNNLLSNAIKFSHPGGEVRVRCTHASDGGLRIAFADDGIGMRAEEIARLKEPFTQAASHHSRRHEGTGLGLYICRKIMELHGGSLELESTHGRGTTVTIVFPPHRTGGQVAADEARTAPA